MPLTTYFRALLCIFVVLVLAEITASLTTIRWLPGPLREYVEGQMNDPAITESLALMGFLSLLALGLMFMSVAGLWVFWRPARLLYTLFLLSLACAVAASGTIVESALTSVLAFMNTIVAGVLLGLLYFSPLREHFDPPPTDDSPVS